jgi:hypothetical protein
MKDPDPKIEGLIKRGILGAVIVGVVYTTSLGRTGLKMLGGAAMEPYLNAALLAALTFFVGIIAYGLIKWFRS